jgi:hypothetical protein
MDQVIERMQHVTKALFAFEEHAPPSPEQYPSATSRIITKIRRQISVLAGDIAYRTLFGRALSLAQAQHADLHIVQFKQDGSLEGLPDPPSGEIDKAGPALVAELLVLLSNLIGEAMTLHLLRHEWPDLSRIDLDPSSEAI